MLNKIKFILPLFLLSFMITTPASSVEDPFSVNRESSRMQTNKLEIIHEAQKLRDKKIKASRMIPRNKKEKLIRILNIHEEDVMNFIQQSRNRDASKGIRLKQKTNEVKIANDKKTRDIKKLLGQNGYNKFIQFEKQMKKEINMELTPIFGKGCLRGTVYEVRKRPEKK